MPFIFVMSFRVMTSPSPVPVRFRGVKWLEKVSKLLGRQADAVVCNDYANQMFVPEGAQRDGRLFDPLNGIRCIGDEVEQGLMQRPLVGADRTGILFKPVFQPDAALGKVLFDE